MSDKKYTPAEAARAVLAKALELYKASPLAKAEADVPKKIKKVPGQVDEESEEAPETAPAAKPAAAATVAPAVAPAVPAAAPAAEKAPSTGNTTSPTKTNTETGGSSPGGASTGGVGSGIGGAGTGGAATGGASTGGAGTVNLTISGNSGTGSNGEGKQAPITINISNIGGRTDAGNVASGDGPGAEGEGGSGEGSGGGGGGAAPDEPENFSTSGKDAKQKPSDKNKKMEKSENSMSDRKITPAEAAMAVLAKAQELFKASPLSKAETGHEKGVHTAANFQTNAPGKSYAGVQTRSAVGNKGLAAVQQRDLNEAKGAHKQVVGEMKQMSGQDRSGMGKSEEASAPAASSEMKGHIKLAKFMGRMEHKKGLKAKEMDKAEPTPWKGPNSSSTGVNAPLPTRETAGWKGNSQSEAGVALRGGKPETAKKLHAETIKEQQSMPKPKLPG